MGAWGGGQTTERPAAAKGPVTLNVLFNANLAGLLGETTTSTRSFGEAHPTVKVKVELGGVGWGAENRDKFKAKLAAGVRDVVWCW